MAHYISVLGLSTFAMRVARDLESAGNRVLAVDIDERRINAIGNDVTRAICGDLRDRDLLDEIGVKDCDTAVLGLPDHFDIGVLLVHYLSTGGVKEIVVQVNNDDQAAAIEKVGATSMVFPERIAAEQLVRTLTLPGLLDRIDVTEDAAIIEVDCPPKFVGESLKELDLRRKFNVHVVGLIRKPERPGERPQTIIAPDPDDPLRSDDILLFLGKTGRLRNLTLQIEKMKEK